MPEDEVQTQYIETNTPIEDVADSDKMSPTDAQTSSVKSSSLEENPTAQNIVSSTDKPFYQSKKFLALASLIPLIPAFLTILPEPYSSYASGGYMIVTALYLLVQGQIDNKEAQNRFKLAMEKIKK